MTFDAIVLAGGRGTRLGGVDKGSVVVGDHAMLDSVLAALEDAQNVICVGPERPTPRTVRWTREDPVGGGPVAALAAGMELVEGPVVVVLAVDLPFVTRATIGRLLAGFDKDGAMVRDDAGRAQPLLAAYRVDVLSDRLELTPDVEGASMRSVVHDLALESIDEPHAAIDVDTPADLALARAGGAA